MYAPPPPPPQAPPPMQPMMQTQGQQFASMLLLSLSFTPLLKQHLLQSLQMSGEELQQMQPVIAHAYEAWDYQVRFLSPHSQSLLIKRRSAKCRWRLRLRRRPRHLPRWRLRRRLPHPVHQRLRRK
jgi:hypothetical protein